MQEITIPVGEICQVQIGHDKHRSYFRGYVDKKYILMDIPVVNGNPLIVPQESFFIMRFLSGEGKVYGFETILRKAYTKPGLIWVVSYPDTINSVNLRKSKRIVTFLCGELRAGQDGFKGAIVDLSEGGGLFISLVDNENREPPETGDSVSLFITLPGEERVDGLEATVRSVKRSEGKLMFGLSFDESGGAPYQNLKNFYGTCVIKGGAEDE